MIGEDWMHRGGVGGLILAGAAALAGFGRWLFTRRQESERSDAETDSIRADVLRKEVEAEAARRVALNGAYRNVLDTQGSLVAGLKAEMDRLREELAEERLEREVVCRELVEERERRRELEIRLASYEGRRLEGEGA